MIPPGLSLVISLIRFVLKKAKEGKQMAQDNFKNELDNFVYMAAAFALVVVVMCFDLTAGKQLATGLFAAVLVKIKSN